MKLLVGAGTLAGTLGIMMMLGMFPSPAYANIFLIDNFTDDDVDTLCDLTLVNSTILSQTSFMAQSGLSEVIDMSRECQLTLLVDNPPSLGEIRIAEFAGMFRGMSGTGVESMSYLQYDGIADGVVGGGRTLNLDLTNSDKLRIQYSKADFTVNVTATLIDGDGDSASLKGFLNGGTVSETNLNFPLANFVIENAALSLGDIDEINVNFTDNVDATDFDVEFIQITMVMVGGEMMPADTTALLLAGAELNAIWILPAIAAIGIGVFVVSRKRK